MAEVGAVERDAEGQRRGGEYGDWNRERGTAGATTAAPSPLAGFVERGGTILAFNNASMTIVDLLQLPVRNVIAATWSRGKQRLLLPGLDSRDRPQAGSSDRQVFHGDGPGRVVRG